MNNHFIFNGKLSATAHKRMNNGIIKKLWNSFLLGEGDLSFSEKDSYIFHVGETPLLSLPPDKEYVLSVDEHGIAIVGKDYGGLMRGFISLLMKIEYDDTLFKIKEIKEESNYKIQNRMLHICVFPENDIYFIKKLLRFSALCQYTHIVLEFWGMLKYDCLKELSWPQAFTKEQVRELIEECNLLGIEPVPMFNMLGHAPASRGCYGKHVVLDQNPLLQNLFTPDGWAWNIQSNEVKVLLKKVREELYELFGKGKYIHIGCDEAFYISRSPQLRRCLPDYLAELTHEIENEGRRAMLWMDMLLEENKFKDCYTTGKTDEVELLRNSTAKSTIFVDWQYDCHTNPVPSLISLKNCNHDVIGAPWHNEQNYNAIINTVAENDLFGIMLTTWHTLKESMPSVFCCAKKCGASTFFWSEFSGIYEESATLFRRVSFEGNSYEECGWGKAQIEV